MNIPVNSLSPARARRPGALAFAPVAHLAWLLMSLSACGGTTEGPGNGNGPLDAGGGGDGDAQSDRDATDVEAVCGDGERQIGEACDDGNEEDGDGCSSRCTIEPGHVCPVPGADCLSTCGNGKLDDGEACDDGNKEDGDGCSAICEEEQGWGCARPGVPCVEIPVCGNGVRERGEECDSGPSSDPGCVACRTQEGFWCAMAGEPCVEMRCGNGVRTPDEGCDDGNVEDGDGCSSSCNIELGYRCSGQGCRAICGDSRIDGDETCDDGNTVSGDGCSAGCQLEPGAGCPEPGKPCVDAVCGNGEVEGGEGCDDGNDVSGDGCSATCQREPTVSVGPNPVVNVFCGDGLLTGNEECDDGNQVDGDGCSSSCKREPGFTCETRVERPKEVRFKVTYRDFRQRTQSGGHPHMKVSGSTPPSEGTDRKIAGEICNASNGDSCGRLDADGKPQLRPDTDASNIKSRHPTLNDRPEAFSLWFRSENPGGIEGTNGAIVVQELSGPDDYLTLTRQGGPDSDTYTFESSEFFPLDGRGLGNTPGQGTRNFHFTTELRYFFQYKGGETLTFRGDDDVFVYINGRLAIDLGGIHGPHWGRVVLGDDGEPSGGDSDCSASTTSDNQPGACSLSPEEKASDTDVRFGLEKGGVYEIVLFHAERHPTGSNFRLTLAGFLAPRSYCTPICGDGIVAGWEACDDGANNADGVYGVCNTTCSGIEYCGDGVLQEEYEECDNGFNLDVHGSGLADACAPGCKAPPFCGDGIVQAPYELCDNGEDNDDAAYDGCNTRCEWGPYCGDGVVDPGEECDDGPNNVGSGQQGNCGYDCKPAFILL